MQMTMGQLLRLSITKENLKELWWEIGPTGAFCAILMAAIVGFAAGVSQQPIPTPTKTVSGTAEKLQDFAAEHRAVVGNFFFSPEWWKQK